MHTIETLQQREESRRERYLQGRDENKAFELMVPILVLLYVVGITALIVLTFPSIDQINHVLEGRYGRIVVPSVAVSIGIVLAILKLNWRGLFGATELAFAIASSISAVDELASHGIAGWATLLGLTYLYAKGFEDLYQGFVQGKLNRQRHAGQGEALREKTG